MSKITRWMGESPARLRGGLQYDVSLPMRLRRGMIGASLVGIGCMALTTLLQTGAVRNLPDPPLRGFRTRKVNLSDEAFSYGGPDSPVVIAAHAVTMIIAATGTPQRARRQPWLPLLAGALAAAQAAMAARYLFVQMPKVDKAWCPYCIADALVHFATLAMAVPEAAEAVDGLVRRQRGGRPIPAYYTSPPIRPRVAAWWHVPA